ncbi:STAS domain-containing protein [Kitasatospora sp. NPDC002551]|uniref:STAS domain-containing protein n=1 Tax=Kitasatospora sp. NPDC002551 TaxID=3154539 RepID=UPI00332B65D1
MTDRPAGPGTRLLVLDGEADLDTAAVLSEALDAALGYRPAPSLITVDCAGLTFCASAGLNEFLRARRSAMTAGIAFRLTRPRPQLRRLLRITEVDTVLEVEVEDGAGLDPTDAHC